MYPEKLLVVCQFNFVCTDYVPSSYYVVLHINLTSLCFSFTIHCLWEGGLTLSIIFTKDKVNGWSPVAVVGFCCTEMLRASTNPNLILLVVVVLQPSLTFQIISVAFYIEGENSDKFCSEALILTLGSFTCRKSTTRTNGFTSLPK